MAQKNILILMADQLNPRYLAAYGDAVGKTPNIDRLAREGVVFDSASRVRHLFAKIPDFPTRPANRFNHLRQFLSPE